MNYFNSLTFGILLSCSVSGFVVNALPSEAVEQITPLNKQQKAKLIHLVKQDCGSCHGLTLKGGLGPSLLPADLINKPEYFLTLTILNGRPGTAMPPWKDILSEQEAQWIAQQLIKGIEDAQQ